MKKRAVIFFLILTLSVILPVNAATEEGYGESSDSLGQFVDSFEDSNNVSVTENVIRNVTLEGMELNYTSGGAGFLSGWTYRKSHTITGTTVGTQTDYQIVIRVYYGSGTDGTEANGTDTWGKVYVDSKSQADFDDIRFTETDGLTLLDHWLEEKRDSSYAIFWIEVDSLPISPSTDMIYVYYGNVSVSSASNGDDTFPIFIDMEDGTLNEWSSTYGTATKTVSTDRPHTGTKDAKLVPAGGSPGSSGLYKTVSAYDDGYAYRVWFYDVPTKVSMYATTHRLHDAGGTSIYLTGQSTNNEYQYYDGAGYQNMGVVRTAGFHYFEYRVNSTFIYLVVDGINGRTSTRLTETNLDKTNDYVYRGNPNPSWFDDYIVRKWVTPEPTHTSWGPEEEAGGYPSVGYFTTTDYLDYANGSILVLMTNSTIPENTVITVEFSEDNVSWTLNDWEPIFGGFEAIDLRELNWSSSCFLRYNLSTSDTEITPRLYQSRLITTQGEEGAPSNGDIIVQETDYPWVAIAIILMCVAYLLTRYYD